VDGVGRHLGWGEGQRATGRIALCAWLHCLRAVTAKKVITGPRPKPSHSGSEVTLWV